jgi:hypothetical protein
VLRAHTHKDDRYRITHPPGQPPGIICYLEVQQRIPECPVQLTGARVSLRPLRPGRRCSNTYPNAQYSRPWLESLGSHRPGREIPTLPGPICAYPCFNTTHTSPHSNAEQRHWYLGPDTVHMQAGSCGCATGRLPFEAS